MKQSAERTDSSLTPTREEWREVQQSVRASFRRIQSLREEIEHIREDAQAEEEARRA